MDAISSASGPGFRVIHFSVQPNHVHMLVEARDTRSLGLGIRGLIIRTAKAINGCLGRKGPVWIGRYHQHVLRTPREVRNGLSYVLQNWKKHVEAARGVDPCSSGPWFDGWRNLACAAPADTPASVPAVGHSPTSHPSAGVPCQSISSPVAAPRTWLASVGWRRHGLLSLDEAPASGKRGDTRGGKRGGRQRPGSGRPAPLG